MTAEPIAYRAAVMEARIDLAITDPAGEAEAVAPILPMTPAAWDEAPSWSERVLESAIGMDLGPFLATDDGAPRFFGPIVEGGVDALHGPPESFKTMAALQLGLAGAAGVPWLGMELGEPRPFVYVAAEKSRATVRDRLERMTLLGGIHPIAPVRIVHRAGVSFGDAGSWSRVVELVHAYGDRTFVVLDTLASLAGPGFDENSGKDMAIVLAALRKLGDAGATVAIVHHPNKHGDGRGGVRLRGHTSLWGEVDGTVEFARPDRAVDGGLVRIEPKDGELRLVHFRWNRETFLVEPDAGIRPLTASGIAGVVDALYQGDAVSSDRIRAEFPTHGRSVVLDRIRDALDARLIAKVGGGRTTGYVPMPTAGRMPDESDSGLMDEYRTDGAAIVRPTLTDPGRMSDESRTQPSLYSSGPRGGIETPPPDETGPVTQ